MRRVSMQETTSKSLKVLIVEDNELAMKVNHMMLKEIGCTADEAKSGEEAVTFFSENHYDVIFMDIGLPKISGIEATIEIRRLEKLNNRKKSCIVALTAYGKGNKLEEECFAAGMDFYRTKPTDSEGLKQILLQFQ